MYRYFSGLEATDTFDFARIPLLFLVNESGTCQPTVTFSLSWQRKPFIQPIVAAFSRQSAKSVSSISVSLLFPAKAAKFYFLPYLPLPFPTEATKAVHQPNCRCFFPSEQRNPSLLSLCRCFFRPRQRNASRLHSIVAFDFPCSSFDFYQPACCKSWLLLLPLSLLNGWKRKLPSDSSANDPACCMIQRRLAYPAICGCRQMSILTFARRPSLLSFHYNLTLPRCPAC